MLEATSRPEIPEGGPESGDGGGGGGGGGGGVGRDPCLPLPPSGMHPLSYLYLLPAPGHEAHGHITCRTWPHPCPQQHSLLSRIIVVVVVVVDVVVAMHVICILIILFHCFLLPHPPFPFLPFFSLFLSSLVQNVYVFFPTVF